MLDLRGIAAAVALANELTVASAHFRALPTAVSTREMPRPPLLLQAIITKARGRVREADLRCALVPIWRRLVMEAIRGHRLRDDATWSDVRGLIAETYRNDGWEIDEATADADGDLLVASRVFSSIRFIAHAPCENAVRVRDGLVGMDDLATLLDTLETLPAVSRARGIVSTTGHFAPGLRDHARIRALLPVRLALRNRHDLLGWMKAAAATLCE